LNHPPAPNELPLSSRHCGTSSFALRDYGGHDGGHDAGRRNTRKRFYYTEATEITEVGGMETTIPCFSYLSYLRYLCVQTLDSAPLFESFVFFRRAKP